MSSIESDRAHVSKKSQILSVARSKEVLDEKAVLKTDRSAIRDDKPKLPPIINHPSHEDLPKPVLLNPLIVKNKQQGSKESLKRDMLLDTRNMPQAA